MSKDFVGRALYLELRRDTETSQVILTPQLKNPLKDSILKPYIISRNLHPDTQRKGWRYSSGPRNTYSGDAIDFADGIKMMASQIEWAAPLLVGYEAGGWKIVNKPLVVDMTIEDAINVAQKVTPSALLRRIMKSRAEAGFPEKVQATLPYVAPTTTAPF